ncbi:MAG: PCMD domain-containing protein [Paramuribaculum sp.]|nr:PCMD domain-containing protein [Paramuribaculum sp.]
MTHRLFITVAFVCACAVSMAQRLEPIKFGDFENWVSRDIAESVVIGGKHKTIFEVGPTQTISKNVPYRNLGGSPWATSNVYAKVSGVTKGSNAVYPSNRTASNKCAKLCTQMENVKVLGLINMNVMVAGSMFLGEMIEPVSSTSDPYKKMDMGMKYTKSPSYLSLDYKVDMPDTDTRTKSTGFGPKKTLQGRDAAVVFIILQRRWEDEDGNLHAARVATGGEHFKNGTQWVNSHKIPLVYGDVSKDPKYQWLGLRNNKDAYYARNSKGKLVKVSEEQWAKPGTSPTHAIVMISSGNGEPFIGTEGLTFYVDNIAFGF